MIEMRVMDRYYLGIDTSAYTTSISAVNQDDEIVFEGRKILKVSTGKRGLRQQEAVFQHLNNLPRMIEKLIEEIDKSKIVTVSASVKPRNNEESYMPVFKVSQGQAFILSKILGVQYKEFSHQEGHIAAGLLGCRVDLSNDFLVLHISGGTTELLYVRNDNHNYDINIIGGTKDISAGQLVDRIGVKLGLQFPCGGKLDTLSQQGVTISDKIPISTTNSWINFSGAETFFYKLIDEMYKPEDIAKSVFHCISLSLVNIINYAISQFNIKDVLIIGGVASNSYVRDILDMEILRKNKATLYLPPKEFCTDNAIGIACLGRKNRGIKSYGGL